MEGCSMADPLQNRNFESRLKRLLQKDVGGLFKSSSRDLKTAAYVLTPTRQVVGISETEASSSLDKIVAAELDEVLNRAATEIAGYNHKISSETMDMVVEIFVDQILNLTKITTDLRPSDNFDCAWCRELLHEPVTLSCGHAFCKTCLKKFTLCTVCKTKIDRETLPSTNILLASAIKKLHPLEYLCRSVTSEGDDFMEKNQHQEALMKYMDANEFGIQSNQAILGRASAFKALGNSECALQDALNVGTFTGNSPEMHLSKGRLLLSMKKEKEALTSFLACLALESTNTEALMPTKQLFEKSLSKYFWEDSSTPKRPKYDENAGPLDSRNLKWNDGMLMETLLSSLVRDINNSVLSCENLTKYLDNEGKETKQSLSCVRKYEKNAVDSSDFECSLCMMLFMNPACTPCGHSFCTECLERSMDHGTECPLCKRKMTMNVKDQKMTSPSLDMSMASIIRQLFPDDYKERLSHHEQDVETMRSSTPVFVCTLALPSMPCPLHIFEPRYRLLLRRAIDIHDGKFGIGMPVEGKPFHEFGTMVKIKNVSFFPDGRSVVESVGIRRFKVIEYGMKDGYNTAKVKYIDDEPVKTEGQDKALLVKLSSLVRSEAKTWFNSVETGRKERIIKHFGTLPDEDNGTGPDGPKWIWWLLAVLPVEDKIKQTIFCKTLVKERLLVIYRVLSLLKKNAAR